MRSNANDSGFTLLEVIVAFAISALALSVLYEGASGGLAATQMAAKSSEALILARSHLAAIGHGEAIAPQETSGPDGHGFTWKLRIRQLKTRELNVSDSDRANDTKPTNAVLFDVLVSEAWKDGPRERSVAIETHRFDLRTAEGE
jgi:general secretion pathway protein I